MKTLSRLLLLAVTTGLTLSIAASANDSGKSSCQVTKEDHAALAQTREAFTPEKIAQLSGDDMANLCKARTIVRRHAAEGDSLGDKLTRNDIPVGMSRFVTVDEYKKVGGVVRKILAKKLEEKGFVET